MQRSTYLAFADQSTTMAACIQSWREPTCRRSSICSSRCAIKTSEEIEVSARSNDISGAVNNHEQLVLVARVGVAVVYMSHLNTIRTTLLFLFRAYLYGACLRGASGLFFLGVWSSICFVRRFQVVNLHLILDLCLLHQGVCGWAGFLVVCFLCKTNPNPRKNIRCGKKWAQMPL